jgi:S-adenosylmethionine synthetase
MKSQVSLFQYKNNFLIDSIVVSIQHTQDANLNLLRNDIKTYGIEPILKKYNLFSKNNKYFINKNGKFIIGGPIGDTGLTGR